MGLLVVRAKFDEPVSGDNLEHYIGELLGGTEALDHLEQIDSDTIDIFADINVVAYAYVVRAIVDLGGILLTDDNEETTVSLPKYTTKPWHAWPWWKRLFIRLAPQGFKHEANHLRFWSKYDA